MDYYAISAHIRKATKGVPALMRSCHLLSQFAIFCIFEKKRPVERNEPYRKRLKSV